MSYRRSGRFDEPVCSSDEEEDTSPYSPTPHKKSPSRKNNTISLLDFEKEYTPFVKSNNHQKNYDDEGVRLNYGQRCFRWVQTAGVVKVALLGLGLGLVFAVLFQGISELRKLDHSADNLLPCPSDELCIEESSLAAALELATLIRSTLHEWAGLYDCGTSTHTTRNATLEELIPLPLELKDSAAALKSTLHLVIYNPHWGIRWMDSLGENKTRWNFPDKTDILESHQPFLSWRCYFKLTIESVWSRLKLIVIIIVALLLVTAVISWYFLFRDQQKKSVYLMVDRIIDLLKKHYHSCSRDKDLLPYLAIIHVRDTLIPPSERKIQDSIWSQACEWISKNESRVRVETRRIAGEDFLVWRWIQEDPPKTEDPVTMATVSDSAKGRGKEWSPWTAIDHYGPKFGEKVAPPIGNPSPFIRLKNMFDIVRMDDEQAKQIENAVLTRCTPHGSVVHIYVDRKSTFGCVYIKMDSLTSANKAYRTLHGGWYNGKLVTAKYIEEKRYVKWFPQAATARIALKPS